MKAIFFLGALLTAVSVSAADSNETPAPAEPTTWNISLHKGGYGSGMVCVLRDSHPECLFDDAGNTTEVPLGETIKIRATPEPKSKFVRWAGDCKGKSRTCTLKVRKTGDGTPLTATAIFK